MGYQRVAAISIGWVGVFRTFNRLANIFKTGILARILSPQQFGTFGVAAIVLGFLEMITETGINVILVQSPHDIIKKYLNTAWTISIIRGAIISLLLIISTPLIISFFNQPDAAPLLLLMSLVPLGRGFINPAIADLQKQLHFHLEARIRISVTLADAFVSITTALLLSSPVSLIFGLIAGVIVEVIFSHTLRPHPKLSFDPRQFKTIVHQGKWITFAGILAYGSEKGSDITIGRLMPIAGLGIFQMAYRLAVVPIQELFEITNRVFFPIYTKIASDRRRLKKAVTKNALVVIGLSVILALILYTQASLLVHIILGQSWSASVPLIKVFSPLPIIIAIGAFTNPLFLSVKKQTYLTLVMGIRFLVLAFTILPLVNYYGLIGGAYALIASNLATIPVRLFLTYRILSHQHNSPKDRFNSTNGPSIQLSGHDR